MALWTGFPAGVGDMKLSNSTDTSRISLKGDESPKVLLKCLARSSHFERKLGMRFLLNDRVRLAFTVRAKTSYAHASSQFLASAAESVESILLNLPHEVLLVIFSSFDHVAGQIALALTCKKLALIARDVNLSLSLTSKKYAGFLPIAVFGLSAPSPSMVFYQRIAFG